MYTKDVAKLTNVHSNTVRLYEEWGYISPVPRLANGYRVYSSLHVKQMQIARLAFQQEFIQNNLRKFATKIVKFSGQMQFNQALTAAEQYLSFLQAEQSYMLKAVDAAQRILLQKNNCITFYSHKEVAKQMQLSEETIRNWERNGLFEVTRTNQNRRIYTELDVQKLLIIRTLRSAHFSIASIREVFEKLKSDQQPKNLHVLLSLPAFQNDFYHITDELEKNLKLAIVNVKLIIDHLHTLK